MARYLVPKEDAALTPRWSWRALPPTRLVGKGGLQPWRSLSVESLLDRTPSRDQSIAIENVCLEPSFSCDSWTPLQLVLQGRMPGDFCGGAVPEATVLTTYTLTHSLPVSTRLQIWGKFAWLCVGCWVCTTVDDAMVPMSEGQGPRSRGRGFLKGLEPGSWTPGRSFPS